MAAAYVEKGGVASGERVIIAHRASICLNAVDLWDIIKQYILAILFAVAECVAQLSDTVADKPDDLIIYICFRESFVFKPVPECLEVSTEHDLIV